MMDTKKVRAALRKKHRHAVLTEMVRQKTQPSYEGALDWDKIRAVAEPYSNETAEIARNMGLQDAGKPVPKAKSTKKSVLDQGKSKKKGGGLFGLFKKK